MRQFYTKTKVAVISMLLLIVGSSFTAKAQQYTLTDADVVVQNGVLKSCSYDFTVKDIIIPETLDGQTVTSIGSSVFKNKGIINVKLPATITVIHSYAFDANKLSTINIPQGVTKIEHAAFRSNLLKELTIPGSVITIDNDAFINNKIKTLNLSEGLVNIGSNAFRNNEIISLNIPATVKNIQSYAFYYNKLISLTIPEGIKSIGGSCFSSNNLTSLILPASLVSIENTSFAHNKLTNVTIKKGTKKIGKQAFFGNSLTSITIPNTVTEIQENAFASNSKLTSITLPVSQIAGQPDIKWIDEHGNTYAGGTQVSDYETYYVLDISYTLTDGDVVVQNGAIKSCSYNFAFKNIIIPETLDGQTVTSIGSSVFKNKGIIKVKLPATITVIGAYAFDANKLSTVNIPQGVTKIEYAALRNNLLKELTIPASVLTIDNDAFINNKIKTLNLSEGLVNIGSNAFRSNEITSINIPATVKNIQSYAFYYNKLTSLTIPEGIKSIGESCFNSNNLTSLILPASLVSIENTSFAHNKLTNVTIKKGTKKIGKQAFYGNSLTSVTIPNTVTEIQEQAFDNNSKLTSITLPVPQIAGQPDIKWIDEHGNTYAGGTQVSDYETYYVLDISYTLTDDDVVVQNGAIKSCSYNFAFKNIIIPETLDGQTVTSIGSSVFKNKGIIKVKLPATITVIGAYAFDANKLSAINIPQGVTKIEHAAFRSNLLKELTIPASIITIDNDVFINNKIKTLNLSEGLVNIGSNAFRNNEIISLNIPATVKNIQSYAFYYNKLTSLTIPEGIKSIGESCFSNNNLTSLTLPASLVSIENTSFAYNKLTNVTIKKGTKKIGKQAFYGNSLTSITIPNTVTEIQEQAFASNSKLTSITLPEVKTEGYNFINWIDSESNIHEANSQVSNFAIGYNANLEIIKCTINGVVKGADGVAIAITGDITDNKTLNNGDSYSLTLNYGQSVEITATKDGEVFENATYTINNIKENKNSCDFITVYNLSGTITGTDGVTVTMSGDASDSKTLNSGDTYNFTVKYNQNVELIPSKEGYNFAPEKYTLTDVNQNTDSRDFVATIKTYTISGTVTGADGVTVTMSGDASANKTVDNGDNYSFTVDYGQSVTITATKDGEVFATNKYAFDDIKENKTDCNFTTAYTVSGTVSGADGVVVELSGDVTAKKVLNSGDTYEFTAQYNQNIAVKASKPGYKFEPATYEFNNIKENSANNHFIGTINTYTISGTVTGANAVTITMSGDASDSKTVNSGDTYNFTVNHGQNVIISATKEGYTFTKDIYNFSNVTENKTDVNFVATIKQYTISGTVTGADAVTITMSGDASDSKTVNSGDTYNFTVNHGQNVTLTATKDGYTFTKDTYNFSNVTENKTDVNFVATAVTYTVQFNIKSEGKAVDNCTIKFNSKDYTTNADGLVTINDLKPGDYSYTVTANGYKEQNGDIKVINKDIVKSIVLIKDDKVLGLDLLDSNNYSLYPNPAKDIITLKSNSTISRVTIVSISGAVVKTNVDECNEAHINISDIKPGIYILRAQTKNGLIIKRFIKQ